MLEAPSATPCRKTRGARQ